MLYAIKVLNNQCKLNSDLLESKRSKFLETDFETIADYEFRLSEIKDYELNIKSLTKATEILIKIMQITTQ